jgi:glycosyltransferase involved in cell wall biosynthesis
MPVYNNASYLDASIESVLNQTFPNFEFIILNDGSTDSSAKIIEYYSLKDDRIVFINDVINRGLIYRLNQGLSISKGEFIARADGDDICYEFRFERQLNYLEAQPETTIVGGWYEYFGMKSGVVALPLTDEDIKIFFLDNCSMVHPLIMARKSFFMENRIEYDPIAIAAEDYDLWTRIAGIAQFANIPEVLLKYRVHSEQISERNFELQWQNSDKCRVRMLQYIWNLETEEDRRIAHLIARPSSVLCISDAELSLKTLDTLISINQVKRFFGKEGLIQFVKRKKKQIVISFYNNKRHYNLFTIVEFINASSEFRNQLSIKEAFKVIVKSIILWKKSLN